MNRKESSICVFTNSETVGFRAAMKGIAYAARERGWSVRIIELNRSAVGIPELLREWQPIGSLSYHLSPTLFPQRSVCVHINPQNDSFGKWTVRHDSRETGDLAAQELLKLTGRTYAFVGYATDESWSRIRGEHFVRTLARFGFGCVVCDVPRPADNPILEQQLLRNWIVKVQLPCAVFAANDLTAESVLGAAQAAGLRIPDDVAILGVDNDENRCENAAITLSSISPDFFHGGALGCALLERRILNPKSVPRSPLFYGDLGTTRRASTCLQLKPNPVVARMREFIRLHAADGISSADVIRETGRQRRGVELAFKTATGKSIGEELQDVRVGLAQRALVDESIQIGAIPALVGYVSQNQLERVFKKACSMTMREYRRQSTP